MRILFFSTSLPQRLSPLLPLARAFRRQGHDVALSTTPEAAVRLEPEGFALLLCGPTPYEVSVEVARRAGADILFSATTSLMAEVFAGTRVDLMADEALGLAERWAPDLIVSEQYDFVGPLVASALELPCAAVASGPAPAAEELHALAATVRPRYVDRGLRPPSHVPSGRWLLDLCPPSLQRRGRPPFPERIGLRAETGRGSVNWSWARRTTGIRWPRVLVDLAPEAETSLGLDGVLHSLGTLDVDLVVTAPNRDVDAVRPERVRTPVDPGSPDGERPEGVSAVVHHGDPDITFATLARGIPAVVVPESPEQQQQAERLAAIGAGIALPAREQDPAVIAAAVGRLLSDARFTVAASRVRDEIAAMPTAAQVARRLVASLRHAQDEGASAEPASVTAW
ncbi:nucleotide disphospho-sugar-binding domain-containing protein [Streptomyces sp. NPDC005813]|uniref:glycosyltransferase n=1 Tax=Streptomyces sp. NPDC005813 TaxID=3155592 RepID=UPI0033FB2228